MFLQANYNLEFNEKIWYDIIEKMCMNRWRLMFLQDYKRNGE